MASYCIGVLDSWTIGHLGDHHMSVTPNLSPDLRVTLFGPGYSHPHRNEGKAKQGNDWHWQPGSFTWHAKPKVKTWTSPHGQDSQRNGELPGHTSENQRWRGKRIQKRSRQDVPEGRKQLERVEVEDEIWDQVCMDPRPWRHRRKHESRWSSERGSNGPIQPP